MPFVIPKVIVFNESNATRLVSNSEKPGDPGLAAYIEWLERETAAAKLAWSQLANTPWDNPK